MKEQEHSSKVQSSGKSVNSASDDAARLSISEKIRSLKASSGQAIRNANDGVSMLQVTHAGVSGFSGLLTRMRELAIQASSDTLSNSERFYNNHEAQALKSEMERVVRSSQYNGIHLLNGSGDIYDVQIGVGNNPEQDRVILDGARADLRIERLGLDRVNLSTKEKALESLMKIDESRYYVNYVQSNIGALENRIGSIVENLDESVQNMTNAKSKLVDADYAAETARKAKNDLKTNVTTKYLGENNGFSKRVLDLL